MPIEQPYSDEPLIWIVYATAKPLPTDRQLKLARARAIKLHPRDEAAQDAYVHAWHSEVQLPTLSRIKEVAWVTRNAPGTTVEWNDYPIDGDEVLVKVRFAKLSQALMFKLTFGGNSSPPLAFAA